MLNSLMKSVDKAGFFRVQLLVQRWHISLAGRCFRGSGSCSSSFEGVSPMDSPAFPRAFLDEGGGIWESLGAFSWRIKLLIEVAEQRITIQEFILWLSFPALGNVLIMESRRIFQ